MPESTKEAANALGFNRSQIYMYIVMPLAVRVSLPALNNNLVNLVKTTTQAFGIAVPELLYQSVTIWNDYPSALYPTMLLVFCRLHSAGGCPRGRYEFLGTQDEDTRLWHLKSATPICQSDSGWQ